MHCVPRGCICWYQEGQHSDAPLLFQAPSGSPCPHPHFNVRDGDHARIWSPTCARLVATMRAQGRQRELEIRCILMSKQADNQVLQPIYTHCSISTAMPPTATGQQGHPPPTGGDLDNRHVVSLLCCARSAGQPVWGNLHIRSVHDRN